MRDDLLLRAALGLVPSEPCPADTEIVDLVADHLPATRSETLREHVARCPRCSDATRDARRFLEAMALPETRRERPPARSAPWAAAATVLLALGAAVHLARPSRPPLSIPEPPWRVGEAEILFRGDAGAPTFAEAREAWEQRDWSRAAAILREQWRAERRDDVAAQLGWALLLAGRTNEAAELFSELRVRGDASPHTLQGLAMAELARGRREAARVLLRQLASGDGPEADAARRMLRDSRGLP